MSVTLNTRTIILLTATIAILVGFAVSQIAFSQAGRGTPVNDAAILKEMKKLNKAIGKPDYLGKTVNANLNMIRDNTGQVCDELTGSLFCSN